MKLHLSYNEGADFPFEARYEGFSRETVSAGEPMSSSGVKSRSYTLLLDIVANDLRSYDGKIQTEFSDYYDEEQQDIAKLVLRLAQKKKLPAGNLSTLSGRQRYFVP